MLEYKEPLSKRNKAETGIRYEWYAMQRFGGPSIGSYKFSRPNTLAFCLAIRQYLITLFGRYDKRIVIPGKDSTINVYIPIFEWCTNRFNLTPDTFVQWETISPTG